MWPLEYYSAVEETPSRKTNPRQGRQPSQSARITLNGTRPRRSLRLTCQPEVPSFQSWKNDYFVKSPTGTLNPEATNEN